jgi:hypothetical protein
MTVASSVANVGKLIENLHADCSAFGDSCFGSIGLIFRRTQPAAPNTSADLRFGGDADDSSG